MKKILLLSLIIAVLSFKYFENKVVNLKRADIDRPMQGDKDNPYAAQEFRYNMLKGNKPYLYPLARQRAINYTKKHLLQKNPANTQIISSWTSVGPGNIGGRIRAILIRPSHPNTMLIGAVSGGVWKTTNGGASWYPTMDNDNPLAIGCMVNKGDIVYAGTGEGWGNIDAVYGGGIYKSTDFGNTWSLLTSTTGVNIWSFKNILKLAFDPEGNIYAVTKAFDYKDGGGGYYINGGLYRSNNGGASWDTLSKTMAFSDNYFNGCDVIPISSSTILFATENNGTTYGGIFKTTDGGANWNKVTNGLPTSGTYRFSMAQDPNNSNTIYAAIQSTDNSSGGDAGLKGIYKSVNAGDSWAALTKPGNILSTSNLSYLGTQGWYDNTIAVDPKNSSNIYVGGVDMMKSTDDGSSWSQLTYWDYYYANLDGKSYPQVVHADHHAMAFDTTQTGVLYDGNDGGIYKSTDDGATWTALNHDLSITQFYGGCAYPNGNTFLGGTQDNGHLSYDGSSSNWTEVVGGDGGYAAISQTDTNYKFEEYVYLDISRTTDGQNWSESISGLTDAKSSSKCLFIAPFSMDPENSSVLIAGSNRIWITKNSAGNWTASSSTLVTGQLVSAVTVVNSSSPYLGFAGTTNGKIFKCTGITGSHDTWTEITPSSNNGAYVRRIVVDPTNDQHIYACYSGYNNNDTTKKHILYSTNQGSSWTDISGDLPDVPVHSLVIDPSNSQVLYIGTETGVYQTTNGGTNWVNTTSGMANYVPVDELVKQTGTDNILAFTHGRGVFITATPLPVELTNFISAVENDKVNLKWQTQTESNNYGFEVERAPSSTTPRENVWKKIGFVKGSGNSNALKNYSFTDSNPVGGCNFSYRIKQIDNDGSFKFSKILSVKVIPSKFSLSQNYPNPFNPTTTIKYSLPSKDKVELKLYNITGREVASLVNKVQQAGIYSVQFNGSNFASGVYFYRLTTSKSSLIKKMILLK
jgi:photosystem II stability/assembly factor-like uncharacterized protein